MEDKEYIAEANSYNCDTVITQFKQLLSVFLLENSEFDTQKNKKIKNIVLKFIESNIEKIVMPMTKRIMYLETEVHHRETYGMEKEDLLKERDELIRDHLFGIEKDDKPKKTIGERVKRLGKI